MLRIDKSALDFDTAMSSSALPDGATECFVAHSEVCGDERVFLDVHGRRCGGRLVATDHYDCPVGVAIYHLHNEKVSYAEIAVRVEFKEGGIRARDGMNEVVIISGLTQSLLRLRVSN